MYYNKIKLIVLVLLIALSAFTAKAQEKDSITATDVIIRVDGSIIYGKVLEVNQEQVKYQKTDLT